MLEVGAGGGCGVCGWGGGVAGGWVTGCTGGMWEYWVWLWARGHVGDVVGLAGLLSC